MQRDKKKKPSGGAEGFKVLFELFKTSQLYITSPELSPAKRGAYGN